MTPTRRQLLKTALTGAALVMAGGRMVFAQDKAGTVPAALAGSTGGSPTKKGEWVMLTVADKSQMRAYVVRPDNGGAKVPAVIVLQEIFGVNDYIRDVAQRIAGLGYVAIAPDLFHRTAPGFESDYKDMNPGIAEMKKMTDDSLTLDLKATYDFLTADKQVDAPRIGSVGYCMGGRSSFLANATLPLKAAAVYYGGGIADTLIARAKDQNAPLIIFSGGKDDHIGRDKQNAIAAALKAAGKSYVDIEFSDAQHGFFCDRRSSYNAEASHESWVLLEEFFKEHL